MSADNWTICPKCEELRMDKESEILHKAAQAYGKVSEDEYHRLKERAREVAESVPAKTLREDYEIGTASHGGFSVNYFSGCDECGYSFNFKLELGPSEVAELAAKQVDPLREAARRMARGQSRKTRPAGDAVAAAFE